MTGATCLWFPRLNKLLGTCWEQKVLSYILKMEVKRENVLSAAMIKMEKGIAIKREPVFGPGGLLRIKREMGMSPMMIKRELIKGEPLDIKPQVRQNDRSKFLALTQNCLY